MPRVAARRPGQEQAGAGVCWLGRPEPRQAEHPALLPKSAGAEGVAAKAAPSAKGAPAKAAPESPSTARKQGEANSACPTCLLVAYPINPITGSKILAGPSELDFALPAPLPNDSAIAELTQKFHQQNQQGASHQSKYDSILYRPTRVRCMKAR